MLAIAAAVACKPDEPVVAPELDINKTSALVTAAGEEIALEVTSNVDWTASADQDWVSVDPASGKGSAEAAKVKVTVDPNETQDSRTATVTVSADNLTKTLKITQTGLDAPEPETYILVGDAVGGWDPANNGVILLLQDGYYVAKAVDITAKKGMHFTKNAAWEGNVKGLHGLIAPNEIGEVGSNDISLTESGKFDVYLTEALDKFYFMSEGKLPKEAVEHVDIAVEWGMMGMFVDNEWGTDVPMEYEGEWIVAKGANFSNLTFKIRGNGAWTDATNIGVAPGSEKGVVNGKISVVTAEYSKANLGGDAADIKLNGAPGTYDVYFSFEKLEVYVMEPGYKPGEKEPQNPEPVEVTYTLTGTIEGHYWENNAEAGLMTLEDGYYVVKNVNLLLDSTMKPDGDNPADFIKFKICETGTWDAYGLAAENAEVKYSPNTEIPVVAGGSDVYVDGAGTYDVYFDKANGKVWVMTPGCKPGETPEPADVDIDGKQWCFTWVALGGVPCVLDLGVTAEGTAILAYDMGGMYAPYMVSEYTVAKTDGTSGILVLSVDGQSVEIPYSKATETTVHFESKSFLMENIDCTLAAELIPIEYSSSNYSLEGKQWIAEVEGRQVLFDFGYTDEGMLSIALPSMDGTEFVLFMTGFYEIIPITGGSGIVSFYQYDWEWGEIMDPFDFTYSDLGEASVIFECENILGVSDPVTFSMVNYPVDITLPGGGGDGPQGEIPNGKYWFVEPTTQKVMTPLGETQNYGRPAAANAINGASTAKNAFTFTYDPDWSGFTIQDSYGRYLYNDMQDEYTPYRTISVSNDIPADSDENKAYYLWTLYDNGDGTFDIYNFATYYSITYSPSYNNWEVYDYQADDFTNLFPTLVPADNPVEEPEPAPGDVLAHPLTSNITWTVNESQKSYSHKATVNGTADVPVLKLGTSSATGSATIVIPAGTTKVGFYGVAWKGKTGTLAASSDLTGQFFEQTFVSNTGAANDSPYTMTVSDEVDYYELDVVSLLGSPCPMDFPVTLSTVEGATRVILFGLNCYTE